MKMLGVDPGFHIAGYSIIECSNNQLRIVDVGVFKMAQNLSIPFRLQLFYDFFNDTIQTHSITALTLETSFMGKNAQNFLKLGYLRGALYLLSQKHSLALHEYAPREIKQIVTGFGGADKEQVARVLQMLFPKVSLDKLPLDASDALAIALCGVWKML